MNWDQIEGKWKQYSGRIKEKWGKLTDDDLEVIRGRRDQLIGKIQERYGIVKQEAEREVNEFAHVLRSDDSTQVTNRSHEEEDASATAKASKRGAGQS
jgi:uncharacterized protein YjbJ (UPF0337 family)